METKMENNFNKNENAKEGLSLREILLIFKRHLVLIIAVVIAFTAAGVGYAYILKPQYTVTQKISYRCRNLPYVNSKGETVNADTTTSNINTMMAYGETIMDLFDEGVVLDRANYYYKEFSNTKLSGDISVDDFIVQLREKDDYDASEYIKNPLSYIDKTQISTTSLDEGESESKFAFMVSYTDDDERIAKDKLAILVYAFEKECAETKMVGEEEKVKYFGEFEVLVSDLGRESEGSNVSKRKTVLLFFLVGVVVALVAVCVVNFTDKTIKSREELDMVVGANTIAMIEKVEKK